jgi:hypothetical protein
MPNITPSWPLLLSLHALFKIICTKKKVPKSHDQNNKNSPWDSQTTDYIPYTNLIFKNGLPVFLLLLFYFFGEYRYGGLVRIVG